MEKEKKITKNCKHHGETIFILESRGYYRCTKCSVDSVRNRRLKMKRMAVELLGGKCSICGYDKSFVALDFHHHEDNKEFGIGSIGCRKSWEEVKKEVEKCILLCANCHREMHFNDKNRE